MSMGVALVLIAFMASVPMILFTRRLKGKDEHTMGLGIGDIKFGQNLGEQHWRELNEEPDKRANR